MNAPEYPQFFRSGARCLKRVDDTNTVEIILPEPKKRLPLSHSPTAYPSKERLDEEVGKMQPSAQGEYEEFVILFSEAANSNSAVITELRKIRFEKQKQKSFLEHKAQNQ